MDGAAEIADQVLTSTYLLEAYLRLSDNPGYFADSAFDVDTPRGRVRLDRFLMAELCVAARDQRHPLAAAAHALRAAIKRDAALWSDEPATPAAMRSFLNLPEQRA
jgi:hypothetical protein